MLSLIHVYSNDLLSLYFCILLSSLHLFIDVPKPRVQIPVLPNLCNIAS
jgi:hypothetical protein